MRVKVAWRYVRTKWSLITVAKDDRYESISNGENVSGD